MNNKIAIKIDHLVKYYAAFCALENISFEVNEGDFFGFLGPNGAGKTTTINVITGLSNYHSGKASVFGHDVTKEYRKTRRLIGLCGQEFNFDPFLDIRRLLVYQAGYFGVSKTEAEDRAESLLKRFQLWDKHKQSFRTLSGGMKRRLLLSRALIHDPKILILDEPTAGADIELKYQIWDYLRKINTEGKTIFLTTHYMQEAEILCRKLSIIHRGQIVKTGLKEDVLKGRSLEQVFLELTQMD